MEFRALSGAASEELERLRESGALAGGIGLERKGRTSDAVLVRPVIGDALAGWMPDLERELAVVKGVVGIFGIDMSEAAGFAADAAAWLGDRGRTVVLVDAVVESPVLGKALAEDRDEGLVDAVLFGVSDEAIVRRTLAPGVSVVTTGSHPLSVDSVFEADAFSKLLRGLAEDALVLVLLPPVHVSKTLGTLDALICIAATEADLASLAACAAGVRTTGILVREQSDTPDAEEPDEAEELAPVVRTTRADVVLSADRKTPARESTMKHPKRGGHETEVGAAETGGAEYRPVMLGGSERRRKRATNRRAVTAALLAIVAIGTLLWWFADGERRITARLDDASRRRHERVAEGQTSEPVGDVQAGPGDMLEAGTTGENTDREDTAGGGGDPLAGEITSDVELEAPGEEIGSAGLEGSDLDATLESPDGDTVIRGPGGLYRIMVSSHRHEGAAIVEAEQLIERGVGAEVMATDVKDRGTWFRVVVTGGYPRLSAAREVLDTIKTLGYEGAWIERAADNE